MKRIAIELTLVLGLLGTPYAMAALKAPVQLDSGLVSGGSAGDPSLTAFWSLPYAAPPVGELRWRPPAPVKPWAGVRSADRPGNQCPSAQQNGARPDGVTRSEDCLNVDVVTGAASASERRPVMVWFHGGTRGLGGGVPSTINGAGLAKKGAVVVTVNYRGGPFGLLAIPELSKESGKNASGNYGLMDDVAALKWIQRNIAAFGGDPGNVTIFGESFGAATCHFISMSPLSKGLFHRMITESHSLYPRDPTMMEVAAKYKPLKDAEVDGTRFVQISGAKSLAELRALPTEKLIDAFNKSGKPEDFLWSYVVDGYVLPRNFSGTYAAQAQADIPVLTGENRDENRASADTAFDLVAAGNAKQPNPATTIGFRGLDGYREYAQMRFGAMADEFLKLYPATSDREAFHSANASIRDNQRISPWMWATVFTAKRDKPVYLYFFTHAPPGPNREMVGVFHSAEIPYAFNKAGALWTDEDRRIADMMSSYWVNFARTGNPNGPGLPNWAAFDGKTEQTMELGEHFQPIPLADIVKIDFWRRFYATQPAR
jgi:para-nitrobenzyl esterase